MTQQVQPVFILAEGTQRSTGKSAQRTNIMAAKLVAETVRTTLGPKGMDKMIVEVAKTQEKEVGDGTTTAVVLAGELLKQAEDLLDKEVHPTVLSRGYRLAAEKAQEILKAIAEEISLADKDLLRKIAITAMTGKGAEAAKEKLSQIAVDAIVRIVNKENNTLSIDTDNIKIEKKVGGGIEDTELIAGIILDKERVHPAMPKLVHAAKIALVDCPIEIKDTETDAKIQITDPSQMQAFLDSEERMLRIMVDKIIASGAMVVFCQKGIDDFAQHLLAKKGILACRRIKKSDMEKLSRATGATIVSSLDDLTTKELGHSGQVEEKKIGDEELTYVTGCKNPKAVTILVRGGTEHVIDEVKRAMSDAIGDLAAALKLSLVVAGGGSTEIEVSKQLRSYATKLSGREQLAVNAFANALEIIPRTLAENAGLDPIDLLTELKAAHDKDKKWHGVDVFTGKIVDSWKDGVIEPLKIKLQAIQSASEVATMILRIDDVIAGGQRENSKGMPHGGPADMGGME